MTGEAFGLTPSRDCPDCDSVTQLVDVGGGVYIAHILHDDTCPWLAARQSTPPESTREEPNS